MEKLIELLNEYEKNVVKQSYMYPVYSWDEENGKILNLYIGFNTEDELKYKWLLSYIVSSDYGFIKWLVENNKIDFEGKLNTLRFESLVDQTLDSYLALLMILSISNSPIEDLILYLK